MKRITTWHTTPQRLREVADELELKSKGGGAEYPIIAAVDDSQPEDVVEIRIQFWAPAPERPPEPPTRS